MKEKYNDDIIITSNAKREPIICFRTSTGHKLLTDAFYENCQKNPKEEKHRVVRVEANFVIEDTRSKVYGNDNYPSPGDFFVNVATDVPDSLRMLLKSIILKNKRGNSDNFIAKILSIAHAIIATARPRSFISVLQVGLAVFFNSKFGSRVLLNLLPSLGYSSTYE